MHKINLQNFVHLLKSQPDAEVTINDGYNTLKVIHATCEYHDKRLRIRNNHLSFEYRIDDGSIEVDCMTVFGVVLYGLTYRNTHGDIPACNSDKCSYMEIKVDSPAYRQKYFEEKQKKEKEEKEKIWRKLGVC